MRRLTASNISAYNFEHNCNLLIDPLQWDVCALPLRNSSIDIVTTDLVNFLDTYFNLCSKNNQFSSSRLVDELAQNFSTKLYMSMA